MSQRRLIQHVRRRRTSKEPFTGLSTERQQLRFEWLCRGILLILGVYLSCVYFGQKAVPNSDFTAFVETGDQVLHFQMPSSFKRVPVLGMLQIAFGKPMISSPHPILTGALVLNAVVYTISILLFYNVCRFFVGQTGSFCLALLMGLNPWSLVMMVDPLAETAIVFFSLLTFWLILRRSRWCYLAAMLASMTRYECFLLIGIAFLFDLFERKPRRRKIIALGIAAAAAVPMLVWMIGTKMTTTNPDSHYFKHFLNVDHRNGFDLLKMLWQTSFSSLLQWPEWIRAVLIENPASQQAANTIQSHQAAFTDTWNGLTAVVFLSGVAWLFLKKQWTLAGLFIFWLCYVGIHMSQSVLLDRYTVPAIWLTLLIAMYGAACSAQWIAHRAPKGLLHVITGMVIIGALLWTLSLCPAVGKTAGISGASSTVVYVSLLLLVPFFAGKRFLLGRKKMYQDTAIVFAVAAMLISNQFALAFRLGQGDLDIEFRKTAEWYLENADGSEKIATTLPGVVNLFLPEGRKNAIHTGGIGGSNFEEFAADCKRRNVLYVAWDSRLGFAVNDYYYKGWGLQKIHPLGGGKTIGPFIFMQKIEGTRQRFIYLYRLDFEHIQ